MTARRPRVAINGFGRIGRSFARAVALDPNCPFDLVAANDLTEGKALAYLLKHDSVHGRLSLPVRLEGETLHAGRVAMHLTAVPEPQKLPWRDLGVDLVIESTGRFRKRAQAALHLEAGAKRVLISAPGDGKDPPDATVLRGVNDQVLRPEHTVISAASCTTTCLAPVAQALDEAFGILGGTMTTVHAYTADQSLVDLPHKKEWRRGRAAACNIVPTTTGAAKAIGLVLPHLNGKLHGVALRVPVPDVSLCDLVVQVDKPATVESVNEALRAAAARYPSGVLRIEEEEVVSTDLMGDPTGSIVDVTMTHVQGDRLVKVVAWYDNEWGYTSRLYALTSHIVTSL